jgi:hypothetical protein
LNYSTSASAAVTTSGNFVAGGSVNTFSSFDVIYNFACYAEGTNIRTSRSEVAVEDLRAGDIVVTASGNGTDLTPIKWIGYRRVDCARHPRQHDVWPVRISAGAFGGGLPERDLLLSPDHSVFMDGVLIPVRYLLNGATITQVAVDAITYFHVELPVHDVILAEGLPCESYLDTGNRSAFANAEGPTTLHPDFALQIWEAQSCARLVYEGPALEAARSWLLDRAESLGHRMTRAPALRLRTDAGMATAEIDGARLRFHLPEGARSLWLESRISVPAYMNPESIDCRPLGVAIGALALDGVAVPLTDARLGDGWHAAEPGLRWTDGRASIAAEGARVLEVDVAMTAIYWDDDAAEKLSRAA